MPMTFLKTLINENFTWERRVFQRCFIYLINTTQNLINRIKQCSFLLILLMLAQSSWAQITLNKETLNRTVAHKAFKLEDKHHEIKIQDLLQGKNFEFEAIEKPLEIIDFARSRWFIRFDVINSDQARNIVFETARPITDRVDLYEVKNKEVFKEWKSGDYIPFNEKTVEHRKNIFNIDFKANETKSFFLILESDGELINLPFIFWEQDVFYKTDTRNNLFHGFYFGVLAVVVFIFFFFYLILKEVSFLYYIIYVAFQFMLQFSLEGFTHQFFFPNSLYFSSISVLISAAGTVIFVILYALSFLKIKERSIKWYKYFNFVLIGLGVVVVMSLIPGTTHAISYPLVNVLSLVGTVSIIIAIASLRKRGFEVNNAFSLGFLILILGAVVFILGNLGIIGDAWVSEMSLKISSGLEVLALSLSMAQRYKEMQEEKENIQKEALETLEIQVEERTKEVQEKKAELEVQNKSILDSIKYAQRIQSAILPTEKHIKRVIPDSFILYKPRDIVSGDFYFVESVTTKSGDQFSLFAAVDCTGHGVPGAFMSFIGNNYLNQSTKIDEINTTGEALDFLNAGVFKSLKIKEYQELGISIRDGMDLTLCGLNHTQKKLYFSGAKNVIQILTKKENLAIWKEQRHPFKTLASLEDEDHVLIEVQGNREAIGYGDDFSKVTFKTISLPIFDGDIIYSYSDGFPDQFGGPKDKKYGSKRFKKFLLKIHHLSMEEQKEMLQQEFESWKGNAESLDDVLVMGVKV